MNLHTIESNLVEIFQQLDEQDGVFTEEQLAQLKITQDDLANKLKDYYYLYQNICNDSNECKAEEERIKALRKSREKKAEYIKNIILDAVINFGYIQKNGVRCIESELFKLTTRKSDTIEIDKERTDLLIERVIGYISSIEVNLSEELDLNAVLDYINNTCIQDFGENFVPFTIDDLISTRIVITKDLSLEQLFKKPNNDAKEMVRHYSYTDLQDSTSKSMIKSMWDTLPEITVAKMSNNLSLQIK